MMPIYRRRRLSKRTSSRSSYRVPFDPRVLQFRPSNNNAIIRPLLQLVQRQHSALIALPQRIRQARCEMEKKFEELNKRVEIFSELNDAYQALIDDQAQKIGNLQSTIDRMRREQYPRHQFDVSNVAGCASDAAGATGPGIVYSRTAGAAVATMPVPMGMIEVAVEEQVGEEDPTIKLLTIATEEELQPQLETEIIYDFV